MRERLAQRRAERQMERQPDQHSGAQADKPGDAKGERAALRRPAREEVAYGSDRAQRYDVYRPARPERAPVIVLVHGGGWRHGDKRHATLVDNKVPHWLAQGYIVVSINYRMLPVPVATQAEDVALAVESVRAKASSWGGDAERIALVGHSAGAHLVNLLNSRGPTGPQPWRAVVSLDSAAFDVERLMNARHLPLFDDAFGSDPAVWRSVSPQAQLSQPGKPLLAVCSSRRKDPCPDAESYSARFRQLGGLAEVLPVALSHKEINGELGLRSAYTEQVDRFLARWLGR